MDGASATGTWPFRNGKLLGTPSTSVQQTIFSVSVLLSLFFFDELSSWIQDAVSIV